MFFFFQLQLISFSFTGEEDYIFTDQIDMVVNVSTSLVRIKFSILTDNFVLEGNESFSISATFDESLKSYELRANEFVADPIIVIIQGM